MMKLSKVWKVGKHLLKSIYWSLPTISLAPCENQKGFIKKSYCFSCVENEQRLDLGTCTQNLTSQDFKNAAV